MTDLRTSPLFDPLLLHSKSALSAGDGIWKKLTNLKWSFLLINVALPIGFLLYIAFSLRNRYDDKKNRYQEYLVV